MEVQGATCDGIAEPGGQQRREHAKCGAGRAEKRGRQRGPRPVLRRQAPQFRQQRRLRLLAAVAGGPGFTNVVSIWEHYGGAVKCCKTLFGRARNNPNRRFLLLSRITVAAASLGDRRTRGNSKRMGRTQRALRTSTCAS